MPQQIFRHCATRWARAIAALPLLVVTGCPSCESEPPLDEIRFERRRGIAQEADAIMRGRLRGEAQGDDSDARSNEESATRMRIHETVNLKTVSERADDTRAVGG